MHKRNRGQSMVEAVVAVGVVILLVTGLIAATTSSLRFGQMSKERAQALQYAKEGLEVVRIVRDASWNTIPSDTQSYCLSKNQQTLGAPASSCPMDIDNMYSRSILFSDDSPTCVAAQSCRKVTVTVSWKEGSIDRSETLTSYITSWRTR